MIQFFQLKKKYGLVLNIIFQENFSGETLEALRITPSGFYCLGKRVDDINNIYEKFSEWVTNVIQ